MTRFIPTYVGHTFKPAGQEAMDAVHPHIRGAYLLRFHIMAPRFGSSPHTWGIPLEWSQRCFIQRFIPTYVGHTCPVPWAHISTFGSSPHTWGIRLKGLMQKSSLSVHPHIRGAYHWTAVRKMAGFSHFSYDFTRKSYFVQGLVFFGVIGAEAFPTHRRGRSQCLPGAHGGSVRNL